MKSKAPLPLMEQIVMLLVFSLAAAVCVQAFVLSDRVSRRNASLDQAVLKAETVAETYKSCRGDVSLAEAQLGGREEGGVWTTCWDGDWKPAEESGAAYRITVSPENSDSALLGRALVTAAPAGGGDPVFTVEIAWQEAGSVA